MEQKEPSMEEILSSIRRILSTEEGTLPTEEELKSSVSEQALTDVPSDAEPSGVMDLTQDMLVENKDENIPTEVPDDLVLLSEATVQASTDKLNALTRVLNETKDAPSKISTPTGDLESLVSSLLRPYLKDWLAENLPSLVEKVVQKEVEKLVNKVH